MRLGLEQWRQDLRFASRALRRAPGFAAAAVLTLAVGIAGTTAMYALVQGVLLRPLPVHEQDRLIVAWKEIPSRSFGHMPYMAEEHAALREATGVLEGVAGVDYNGAWRLVAVEDGAASYMMTSPVTGEFFDVLGVAPVLGRALHPADDVAGAAPVIVISHGLWQRRWGGSPTVLGRSFELRERSFTVVGVMPRGFEFPRAAEAWITLSAASDQLTSPTRFQYLIDVIARLRPGATVQQAAAELEAVTSRLQAVPGMPEGQKAVVHTFEDAVVGDVRRPIIILFAAVALILLIASANVANLLLIRGASRRPELAVRAALGAGRGRLARQALAESAVLAFWAAAVAFALTWWGLDGLVALVPDGLPRIESIEIDRGVALFTVLIAFLTTTLAGAAPALSVARANLPSQLRSGGRGPLGGSVRHGRRALVIAQVALAVMVVAVAGLLTRSLLRLQSMDMGLARDRLVFVQFSMPRALYTESERQFQFMEDLRAQLESAPGVAMATPVNVMPFSGTGGWDIPQFAAEGQEAERAAMNPSLNMEVVYPNYFDTFGIQLVRGRAFTDSDHADSPPVAIVSQDVATRTWPGVDPIGKRLKMGGADSPSEWRTVVGVAAPVRYRELFGARATIYFPARQFNFPGNMMVVRTTAEPGQVAALTRERVRRLDSTVQVMDVAPFATLLDEPLARPRFSAFLISIFGVAALLLAALGLYGVMSAYVRQRYTEIGIRLTLGATPRDVRRLILEEGLKLALMGAALGLVGAVASARILRGVIYEVHPLDPGNLLAAGALLIAVALLACYLPARRATRVDPMAALRAE
jgi:putative ABC transport system permease protein